MSSREFTWQLQAIGALVVFQLLALGSIEAAVFDIPMSLLDTGVTNHAAVGDFNGDGAPDFAATLEVSGLSVEVVVFINDGSGGFRDGVRSSLGGGYDVRKLHVLHVNGDGNWDLIAVSSVPILLVSNGDGTFEPAKEIPVWDDLPLVSGLASGDFDGDGWTDLAMAGHGDSGLLILINSGDDGFSPGVVLALDSGGAAWDLASAHLDDDGILDLFVVGENAGHVFLGIGNGDFATGPVTSFGEGIGKPVVAVDDFDQDGHLDAVVAGEGTESLRIYNGLGDGGFGPPTVLANGAAVYGLHSGNLDRGEFPDLLLVLRGTGQAHVRLNDGAGTFHPAVRCGPSPVWPSFEVQLADFDLDGNLDFADRRGMVLYGRGDGTFGQHALSLGLAVVEEKVLPYDLDGDGVLDLVTCDPSLDRFLVHLGWGNGFFRNPLVRAGEGSLIAVGDFNLDGFPDLVARRAGGGLSVSLGDVNLSCSVVKVSAVEAVQGPYRVTDANRDGLPDLVCSDTWNVTVYLGEGDGTFQEGIPTLSSFDNRDSSFQLADFDLDGTPDVLVPSVTEDRGFVRVLLGEGDGTYRHVWSGEAAGVAHGVAVDDFNGDSIPDIVATNVNKGSVSLWLGDGLGGSGARSDFPTEEVPGRVITADFNGDGHIDLAIVPSKSPSWGPPYIALHLGRGDGTFAGGQRYYLPKEPRGILAADFDNDGDIDLLAEDPPAIIFNRVNQPDRGRPLVGLLFH